MNLIRTCMLGLSLYLIIFGLINGSADDVLAKAVRICMECIGLG